MVCFVNHYPLYSDLSDAWLPTNFMLGVTLIYYNRMYEDLIQGGLELLRLYATENRDKRQPDGSLGSNTDFTYTPTHKSSFLREMSTGIGRESLCSF